MYSMFVVAFTKKAKFKSYMPTKLYNFVWLGLFFLQKYCFALKSGAWGKMVCEVSEWITDVFLGG